MSLIVVFHNDSTGTEKIGNYDIDVYINQTKIHKSKFLGHKRHRGWRKLVFDWIKTQKNQRA